jgi:hypothetical protein
VSDLWILFDMVPPRILHTAPRPEDLRFEEGELPPHLQNVWVFRTECIQDSFFLGSRTGWHELNLRQLYMWLKLSPPLTPTRLNDDGILDLRNRIRNGIAAQLGLEPNTFEALQSVTVKVEPPKPPVVRMPPARRGSVGPIIHSIATEMWETAGSPRDLQQILILRKSIMKTLLEDHQIKTVTSSNELGRWQKNILNGVMLEGNGNDI